MSSNAIEIRQPLEALFKSYNDSVVKVDALLAMLKSDELKTTMQLFADAENTRNGGTMGSFKIAHAFNDDAREGVIKELDATHWSRAFNHFGFFEMMPSEQRNKWNELIYERKTPHFEENVVIPTLEDFYLNLGNLQAEKLLNVFNALSRSHVTNIPEGFYKRFIIQTSSWSYIGRDAETVTDFIQVACNVCGIEMSLSDAGNWTRRLFNEQPKDGQWYWYCGGIFKVRAYQKGTIHIEVNPELAWQLNKLMSTHPACVNAIPAQFSKKPERRVKAPELFHNFLQPNVLKELQGLSVGYDNALGKCVIRPKFSTNQRIDLSLIDDVCELLGGERIVLNETETYAFDYDCTEAMDEVITLGRIPDKKAYQFYPTSSKLAEMMVNHVKSDITDNAEVLEPSCGGGNLIKAVFDANRNVHVTGIDIDPMKLNVCNKRFLSAMFPRNLTLVESDFLKFKNEIAYDVIVMNPPFTGNQQSAHINHALTMLSHGGKLVSIVSEGFNANQLNSAGYKSVVLSEVITNGFRGTGIGVRVLSITR